MSDFVARPAILSGDTDTEPADGDTDTRADPFYPPVRLTALRQAMRLDGNVTTARLKHLATEAVLYVQQTLHDWQMAQQSAGYLTLEDVPSPAVNGESAHTFRYRHAVYCFTKAALTEQYRDIDTTREGEKHALALGSQIADLQRDGQYALQDIRGRGRLIAEIV